MRNLPWPKRSSTLSPKIQRYSMLPNRCAHPACMNIDVKSVGMSPAGFAMNRSGTNAHCRMNGSPPFISTKKNRTLAAISAYVTTGEILRAELSSPIGNMRCLLFHRVRLQACPSRIRCAELLYTVGFELRDPGERNAPQPLLDVAWICTDGLRQRHVLHRRFRPKVEDGVELIFQPQLPPLVARDGNRFFALERKPLPRGSHH